jgi:hypothetical protein
MSSGTVGGILVAHIQIAQASFVRRGDASPELLARSPRFLDEWVKTVTATLVAFGARPVGVACPSAVFARPLGSNHVLVVHAADLDDSDTTTRPLGFHVLVVPRKAYQQFWHNPFWLAEQVRPDWQARGELPVHIQPDMHIPVRTVEQVRQVLRRIKGQPLSEDVPGEEQIVPRDVNDHESPALLGGAQVLVDGGKLVLHRPRPDTEFLDALWTLLPNSVRGELWPASFAFSNELQFDVLVVPRYNAEDFQGYTTEELAADYPEGRYEHQLQMAAENGNQHELSALFERRSARQTWRMGIVLLVAVSLIVLIARLPVYRPPQPPARAFIASGMVGHGHHPINLIPFVPLLDEQTFKDLVRQAEEQRP